MNNFNGTTLCAYCEEFRNVDQWSSSFRTRHHSTASTLRDSAQAGCHLCSAFVQHGLVSIPKEEEEETDGGLLSGKSNRRQLYLTQRAGSQQRSRYVAILETLTPCDDPLAPLILGRPVARASHSETCLETILTWYERCRQEHLVCGRDEELPLPTRVLDVGSETRVPRLLVTEGRNGHYATLSHCWGNQSPITTTLATLEDRQQGIRMEDLPPTFSDAVTLTRRLGLQYLWVDSLCIIQDSHDDWLFESARMGDVYRGGSVNIAASAASNATEGLFESADRERDLAEPVVALPCFSTRLQSQGTVFLRRLTTNNLFEQPLHRRGWVLQESILSPRRVDFAASQLYWSCREYSLSEAFPTEDANNFSDHLMAGSKELYHMPIIKYAPCPDLIEFELTSPMRWWYTSLQSYVLRSITKHEDLLPAIAGVARKVAHVSNYRYQAGLWEEDVLRGLLWQCSGPITLPSPTSAAPSWSWASTNVPWSAKPRFGTELDYYLKGFRARVLDFRVENVSDDPFGQVVRTCTLRLETRYRPLHHFTHSSYGEDGLLSLWLDPSCSSSSSDAHSTTPPIPIRCALDCIPSNPAASAADLLRRHVICAQISPFGEFRPDVFYHGDSSAGSVFSLLLEPVHVHVNAHVKQVDVQLNVDVDVNVNVNVESEGEGEGEGDSESESETLVYRRIGTVQIPQDSVALAVDDDKWRMGIVEIM